MPALKGQFLSPRPPRRAWGSERVEKLPAPGKNEPWIFNCPVSSRTRVLGVRAEVTFAGAEVEAELLAKVVDQDGGAIVHTPSGLLAKAAGTHDVQYLSQYYPPGHEGIGAWLSPLPDVLLRPGWKLEGTFAHPKGEVTFGEVSVLFEEYEEDSDHDAEQVEAMIHHLHKIEELLCRG